MRSDADNIRKLEQLKPRYEALKASKIRTASELERRQQDLAASEAEALALVGTADENEIREIISSNWKANSEAVDYFEQMLLDIEGKVAALVEAALVAPLPSAPPKPVAAMRHPMANRG